jgi:3-dehydroquinate dehydratase
LNLPTGEWYFAALAIGPDQGKLYLNGADTTATNVAEHLPGQFDSLIRVARDHNDDRIMTSTIDEVRLYNKTLNDAEIVALMLGLSDVTAAGDVVQGVPNDGDWPGGETPDLAVDDNTGTKYLHFKGETEASGFQVTPAVGRTLVTGLTFTSANDAAPRDPVTYELSGSNESIDGPYELIASGDIADFAQADAIARFTKTGTPILFENAAAYTHYQVMFPTVRDAGNANSMQIAEVELLGVSMATDIAIFTKAGWWGQDAADREAQEIVDNVTTVAVEQFTADQEDALADWVVAHTGNGVSDLLIMCGNFPDSIYPGDNAQPDDSLAELFLDDGNTIVNTGDYIFYVGTGSNNATGGLENMMDLPGVSMWGDGTPCVPTAEALEITPSLVEIPSTRPFFFDQLVGDWYPELVLGQTADGAVGDPVIVRNSVTGGRLGIFFQVADALTDIRGEVISEWINNWYLGTGR